MSHVQKELENDQLRLVEEIMKLRQEQRRMRREFQEWMSYIDTQIETLATKARTEVVGLVVSHEDEEGVSVKIHGTASDVKSMIKDRTRHCPQGARMAAMIPCPSYQAIKDSFHMTMGLSGRRANRGWYRLTWEEYKAYLATPLEIEGSQLHWMRETSEI